MDVPASPSWAPWGHQVSPCGCGALRTGPAGAFGSSWEESWGGIPPPRSPCPAASPHPAGLYATASLVAKPLSSAHLLGSTPTSQLSLTGPWQTD